MSRRTTISPTDSEPKPNWWVIIAGAGLVLALCLLGFASALTIGRYLPDASTKAYWFISRSSGVIAYGLLTLGMLWGLMQSGKLFRSRVSPLLTLGMHSYLSWLGLGLAALHGAILIGDGYIKIDLIRVFTPFLSEYRPVSVGLGIIAFYLMLLLALSFYARSYLGQRNFRLFHYGSFGVFVLVTLHGIFAGTDSASLWWLYALSLALVTFLAVLRIISTRRDKGKSMAHYGLELQSEPAGGVRLANSAGRDRRSPFRSSRRVR